MLKFDVISLEPEKNENRKWCKIFGVQYITISKLLGLILATFLKTATHSVSNMFSSCLS